MITAEQLLEGLLQYLRHEVLPALPVEAKLLAGAALLHNTGRVGELMTDDRVGPLLRTIGLVSSDGCVDADAWCQDLRRSMDEFCSGRAEIKLPFLQPIIFSPSDVDVLKRYVKGELR